VRTSSHKDVNRHHGLWNAWQRSCTLANIATNEGAFIGDTEMMCSDLEFEADGRLVLYPGEDKHALYPSTKVCEDVDLLTVGYGEDCGWDPQTIDGKLVPGQWKDSDFNQDRRYQGHGRWLFDAYNVGEPNLPHVGGPDLCHSYQLVDFLDQPDTWRGLTTAQKRVLTGLYPNEAVWSGTAGKRAEWDPNPVACTLAAGNDGGDDFCGGLGVIVLAQIGGGTHTISKCSTKLGSALGQAGDWTDKGPPDLISDALNARYQVTIKTGDMERAGTDAKISLALSHNGAAIPDTAFVFVLSVADFEHSGNTAPNFRVGSFERGDTDNIYLNDNNAGEVSGIRLSQDGTGTGPGWFVEQIVVRDLVTGKTWAARPQRWLATDSPPNTTSAYIELSPYNPDLFDTSEYQVIVATGDLPGAGTDGDVSITLTGDNGATSGPLRLNYNLSIFPINKFERDRLDTFTVSSRDIGPLASLRVELKPAGDYPEWYCREVTVRNLITGQEWVFPIETWLGMLIGPLSVDKPPEN